MSPYLPDVNVLLALVQEDHQFHVAAREWFHRHRSFGWATCAITESGFARVAAQSVTASLPVEEGFEIIRRLTHTPEHQFWALDYPLHEMLAEIRYYIRGPKLLTDAVLLDLAIRRGGRLATLDRGVLNLLPPDSPHHGAIELISPRAGS